MTPVEARIRRAITRNLSEGYAVAFSLKYAGPLPSANKSKGDKARLKKDIKQRIRRQFHPQLSAVVDGDNELFYLMQQLQDYDPQLRRLSMAHTHTPKWVEIGESFRRGSFHFLPLVLDAAHGTCQLAVQFFRRDKPGSLIVNTEGNGGDLDNRLKTLFDALQIPGTQQLPDDDSPSDTETPFFCLLQDDSLITRFSVESKTLLTPATQGEEDHVELIIDVTVSFRERAYYNERINI